MTAAHHALILAWVLGASPGAAPPSTLSSVQADHEVPTDLDQEASARLLRVIEVLNQEPQVRRPKSPDDPAPSASSRPAVDRPLPIVWTAPAVKEDTSHLLEKWDRRPSADDLHRSIEAALAAPSEQPPLHSKNRAIGAHEWTPAFLSVRWEPTARSYAGRVTRLARAFDPSQGITTLWAGTVGGGLWKVVVVFPFSFWVPVSHTLPGSPSVGAFLVRPSDGAEILIGTGDSFRYPGDGMYKTSDGGSTWERATSFAPAPSAIYRIRASRTDDALVLAASDRGLFRSEDFGENWSRVVTQATTDIVQDPANSNRWITAVRGVGVQVSVDGGRSFAPFGVTCAQIPGPIARVSLAVTPAATSRLFALVENAGILNGIYRSDNSGCTWASIESVDSNSWGQAFHALAIAADPTNANRVFVGMGGAQWTSNALAPSPCWVRNLGTVPSDCGLVIQIDAGHADMTDFLFLDGTTTVLISNDGGVFEYDYALNSIADLGNALGFSTIQTFSVLHALSASRTSSNILLVGTQDNGTSYVTGTHARILEGLPAGLGLPACGDGGQTSVSPVDEEQILYSCGINAVRWTSDDAGSTPFNMTCGLGLTNPPVIRDPTPGVLPSYIYDFTLSRDSSGNSFVWFKPAGSNCMWQKIHTVALPLSNANVLDQANNQWKWLLYVAQDVGTVGDRRVFVLDGGTPGTMSWVQRTPAGIDLPLSGPGADAHLFADRSDSQPETAYYTTGTARPSRAFLTINAGLTWREVTGNLGLLTGNANLREMIGDPTDLRTLVIGTDIGVFRTDTADQPSPYWYRYMNGLPAVVAALNLEVTVEDTPSGSLRRIRVGTYGQGVWERLITETGVLFMDGFESGNLAAW